MLTDRLKITTFTPRFLILYSWYHAKIWIREKNSTSTWYAGVSWQAISFHFPEERTFRIESTEKNHYASLYTGGFHFVEDGSSVFCEYVGEKYILFSKITKIIGEDASWQKLAGWIRRNVV